MRPEAERLDILDSNERMSFNLSLLHYKNVPLPAGCMKNNIQGAAQYSVLMRNDLVDLEYEPKKTLTAHSNLTG